MLIGEFEHSLDAKGRLIMPAKLRESIGENFVVTKGLDGCLFAFSTSEWTNFEEKLKSLPLSNRNSREFTRFFLSGASECEIDKQGRIPLSSELIEYAGMKKDIVLVGVNSKLEIWDSEKWKSVDEAVDTETYIEGIAKYGINI